ncbi:MAG: diphosphomevalonate decarboxylase [Deltaproteobacteria bacterium]|nr:diphosphomevalonate decarboxylase [Deltaproteobacteria bacterium]
MKAVAKACSNIALVKYWGKRDAELNLPAGPSISMTLDRLKTTTAVDFQSGGKEDVIYFNGKPAEPGFASRVESFLDLVRSRAGITGRARVDTNNDFPTKAGMASSASGFAALALAATCAAGMDLNQQEMAGLARMGSGSASRSIVGGFAEIIPGDNRAGLDFRVRIVADPMHWDLKILVGVVDRGEKYISSRRGMAATAGTSPFYKPFLESSFNDVEEARSAILERDINRLGPVVERSCLRMHACAMAADPGIVYWLGPTMQAFHAVRRARSRGLPGYFTLDAGPNPMVVCEAAHARAFEKILKEVDGVRHVITAGPGPGASVDVEHE